MDYLPTGIIWESMIAGIFASLACGLGVLPLLIPKLNLHRHTGLAYGFAGGLMMSASVYNLIAPGINMTSHGIEMSNVLLVVLGILLGSGFLHATERLMDISWFKSRETSNWGGRMGILIFIAMSIHSIPEGVAVGVGYTSGQINHTDLGLYLALAIAIHNIPEGLAVAIPLRSAGASINRCFWTAVLTSLPQPLAAVPAVLLSWFFQPIMPMLMGFAAGAMIFLILMELLPHALSNEKPMAVAWLFMSGFCLMLLIQIIL